MTYYAKFLDNYRMNPDSLWTIPDDQWKSDGVFEFCKLADALWVGRMTFCNDIYYAIGKSMQNVRIALEQW